MISNLDVDQLKTFLAIASTGSFTKAAEEVNKTQSAVSMQMQRLEQTLGKALFAREGRGSKLTIDGERFIAHARKLVAMNDDIVSAFSQPPLTGTVRFGIPDDYADIVLPEVLGRFSRSNPFVTVDVDCISSVNLKERLKRSELDLALVTFGNDSNLGEVLRREDVHWVGSSRHDTHLKQTIPIAVADVGCEWRQRATETLTTLGKPFRVAYSSPNRSVIDAAVLQGLAIAVLPEVCIKSGMRILTEKDGFPEFGQYEIGLIRKHEKLTPAAEALAQHVRESFGRKQDIVTAVA